MIFNIPITESVNVSSLKIIKDPSSYIIKNGFKVRNTFVRPSNSVSTAIVNGEVLMLNKKILLNIDATKLVKYA